MKVLVVALALVVAANALTIHIHIRHGHRALTNDGPLTELFKALDALKAKVKQVASEVLNLSEARDFAGIIQPMEELIAEVQGGHSKELEKDMDNLAVSLGNLLAELSEKTPIILRVIYQADEALEEIAETEQKFQKILKPHEKELLEEMSTKTEALSTTLNKYYKSSCIQEQAATTAKLAMSTIHEISYDLNMSKTPEQMLRNLRRFDEALEAVQQTVNQVTGEVAWKPKSHDRMAGDYQ